jgi:aminoglycoside phosphotransferase (APT) family kinase protein
VADGAPVRSAVPLAGPLSAVRPALGRLWYEWRGSGRRRAAVAALTDAVRALPPQPGLPPPARWAVQRVLPTETDVTVAVYGVTADVPLAVGRITEPDADDAELVRNGRVLADLCADERLGDWRSLLPLPLAAGRLGHRGYAVERAMAGRPAVRTLRHPPLVPRVLDLGAAAISMLHRATAVSSAVGDPLLERWVDAPLRLLEEVAPTLGSGGPGPAVDRLADTLRGALAGRPCVTAWTHGDYWLGNLLLAPRGDRVTGIVDWGAASADGLPVVDLLHLLLTARMRVERVSLGSVVTAALRGGVREPAERELLASAAWSWPEGAPDETALVLLAWLGHVSSVMIKRPAYRSDRRWLEDNVGTVLRGVAPEDGARGGS